MGIDIDYIRSNIENFELISVSTNKVYRFTGGHDKYILKIGHESTDALSPFWWGIKEVFGSTFDTQRDNIEDTLLLLDNPHIQTARFVMKSHRHKFIVFQETEGRHYEPDEFPRGDWMGYQLGQFIGCIHSKQYDYFGHQASRFRSGFKEKMLYAMSAIIKEYWADSQAVHDYYGKIRHMDISPASYSLIMPDISANQFVFDEGFSSIKAVVDFDAYVMGPREWELSVIEMCLENCGAFKQGYEQYGPLPNLHGHRDFYRFFMYLCDPWEKQDLASFMSRNIQF